jgi:hypothetical protein
MVLDCVVQREVVSHLQVGFGIMLKDRKIGPEVGWMSAKSGKLRYHRCYGCTVQESWRLVCCEHHVLHLFQGLNLEHGFHNKQSS